ncbi:acetylornithine deacetylase [Halomonas urumqiensis]|uniref:Acetylornithine deacetylase n=2 Tax=Halomonas urumqiensis TaxID=1684789 RepID=A0A2N7UQN1_9GAMM|nr:acetylornithine deacetylase [Halomonas urumqiensis]PTB01960.1 acetylornithine deacetylase [Halomonas urumqiensis]GHE22072.1 acetylornithine deacetylase [Halomonas urumqiensis]
MTAREQRVLEACDAIFDDTLSLAEDLVREYSVLGHEQGVVAVMEGWYQRLGLAAERVPLAASAPDVSQDRDGRDNVVARLNPDADGPHLVFNGHLDVVPAEPVGMWTRPPWEPWRAYGWLYGRGAGDMKAGIAAMVTAVVAVQRAGVPITFPLTLQTVIEEECTGNGALACIQQGMGGDFVLIPEPFGATLTSGQVGVLWFRVQLDGVPAHVLDTGAGSNAIEAMTRLLPALKALEAQVNALPREAPYDTLDHPFNLSIGRLDGGNWASSVPSHAVLEGRMGFPPGMPVEEAMRWVQTCIEGARESLGEGVSNLRIEFHGFRSNGHRVDLHHPGIRLLGDCHQALLDEPITAAPLTCTTDLCAFNVAGVSGSCYGPVAERIHGVDERVDIASIRHTLKAYALFLCRWGEQSPEWHKVWHEEWHDKSPTE